MAQKLKMVVKRVQIKNKSIKNEETSINFVSFIYKYDSIWTKK